jgi:hypothetical protein
MAGLARPSTSLLRRCREDVDARDKRGHDEEGYAVITGLVPVIPLRSAQLRSSLKRAPE